MATNPKSATTDFTRDVLGRYVCNGLDEALRSADQSVRPDARPFDVIVIGGGTFGAVFASHLFAEDTTHSHRILVLEAGPIVLPEHTQNLPLLNTDEVWGVPWNSDSPRPWNQQFPGLAYCVGGRSVFWGGWSPYFLDSELPSPPWPASVIDALTKAGPSNGNEAYLDQAARQIGTDSSNDFIFGATHTALRDRLFTGLKNRATTATPRLVGHRGAAMAASKPAAELKQQLEAPLAVQATAARPGFFPFNKFSGVPLLIRAARQAYQESAGDDVFKRLMVVPNTHVIRLDRVGRQITRVVTNQGTIDVPSAGQVFLALGTIENTRMALATLANNQGLIGRNLMAHLRSNLTIRIKRSAFGAMLDPLVHPELRELQVSALFVKGVHTHPDGSLGHFHVQITASGVGDTGKDSEAELFKKVPDIDGLDHFRGMTDQWIVMTLRGIGEMVGDRTSADPLNRITLGGPSGNFDYGTPRAQVRLDAGPTGSHDLALWEAMDRASDELALVFANSDPTAIQYLSGQAGGVWQHTPPGVDARRDKLSSTHHEGGTLWMGDDASTSVTDALGRFHETDNLYALGPALLPTLGSPNPMLSGVGLARRTADALRAPVGLPLLEPTFTHLFDGSDASFRRWQMAGQGRFALVDGALVAEPGPDLGLCYYSAQAFGDFTLRLQVRLDRPDSNSGVFVRFRNPRLPVPDRTTPNLTHIYANQAFVGVDTGFEVQIDELARGDSRIGQLDGFEPHRTGAIYNAPIGRGTGMQAYRRGPIMQPGTWHDCEIEVIGDRYTVRLDGQVTTSFTNADGFRGRSIQNDTSSGYIGLQVHSGRVALRNVRICAGRAPTPLVRPAATVEVPQATLRFGSDWTESFEGNLRPGALLAVEYDLARLPGPDDRRRSGAADVVGYVHFEPSGEVYSGSMLERFNADFTTQLESPQSRTLRVRVPLDAIGVQVWFHSIDLDGSSAWDSRFGQNFSYAVGHTMPRDSVRPRREAIPRPDVVSVLWDSAVKTDVVPRPQIGPPIERNVETRLLIKAWVNNLAFQKNAWADVHVFDDQDRLIEAETIPLGYRGQAGGNGDVMGYQGAVYHGSVATPGDGSPRPDARKLQYRLYCEENSLVFTDNVLHQLEVPSDTESR